MQTVYVLYKTYHVDCYKRSESGTSILRVSTDYHSLLKQALLHNVTEAHENIKRYEHGECYEAAMERLCKAADPTWVVGGDPISSILAAIDKLLDEEATKENLSRLTDLYQACLQTKGPGEYGFLRSFTMLEVAALVLEGGAVVTEQKST